MTPADVTGYWFGTLEAGLCTPERRKALFRADADFDARLRERFEGTVDEALAGELDAWATTSEGSAALVLLLDQFTRNLHRGTPRAFAGDDRALMIARAAVNSGQDAELPLEMRVFLYLPFEHAEQLAAQDEGVALLTRLLEAQAPDSEAARVVQEYLGHARAHRDLIARFQRFPHRNRILSRADTAEESAWLAQDARRFGQG